MLSSWSISEQQHPIIRTMIYTYNQLSFIQMSFFERMMRISQPQQNQKEELQDSEDEQEEEEVPDEPRVEVVYASAKPVLLGHLLPKREQLLRDMMARKRQFQMKKMANSNIVKGAQLKQRLEDGNSNFVNGIQQQTVGRIQSPQNIMHSNESNKGLKTSATTNILPHGTNNMGQKSLNQSIVQKSLKESLVLQISASSRRKDSECSNMGPNVPMGMNGNSNGMNGGDPLSRQIMLRLLNMLQNERNDRKDLLAMSMSNHFSLPHEKQQPIVINNILKTPVDALNKDLIERQMKIRLLEDHRMRSKQAIYPIRSHPVDLISNQPLTQRSELPHCQQFTPTEQRNSCQGKQKQQGRQGKVSLECSRISIESIRERQVKLGQKMEVSSSKQEQSTKPCSNFSSQITETEPSNQSNHRERHFNRPNRPSNRNQAKPNQPQPQKQQQITKEEGSSPTVNETIIHKASIRLDIPLNESSEGEGLTLAEAFKKRIGKLKSEKEKTKKTTPPVAVIGDENFVKTELYPEYKTPKDTCIPLFPLESTQTVNLSKKRPKNRTQHVQAQFSVSSKQSASGKSKDPAKGLIDRLIGGERAKVSKKEMYALTKKNYENLPQVQAKKKEEEKRDLEMKRLARIRELQRSTRSMKGSSIYNQNIQNT